MRQGLNYVAFPGLELSFSCVCFLSAGIKDVYHHSWQNKSFLFFLIELHIKAICIGNSAATLKIFVFKKSNKNVSNILGVYLVQVKGFSV